MGNGNYRFKTLAAITALLAVSVASATDLGTVTASHVELDGGMATGVLGVLRVRHDSSTEAMARPTFSLDAERLTLERDRADYYAQGNSYLQEPQTTTLYDDSPASLAGTDNRASYRLWVLPLNDHEPPVVEIYGGTYAVDPPATTGFVLEPLVNLDRPDQFTNTSNLAAWNGGQQKIDATLRGDFLLVAWEWDLALTEEGGRTVIPTGISGPAADQRVGTADEVWVVAYNATLTIPLQPDTFNLYLGESSARDVGRVKLSHVEGDLQGVAEALAGDLVLFGNLGLGVEAHGPGEPLTMRLQGDLSGGTLGDQTWAVPGPPSSPAGVDLGWLAPLLLALLAVASGVRHAYWPWHVYRMNKLTDGRSPDVAPRTPFQSIGVGWSVLAADALDRDRLARAARYARRGHRLFPSLPNATWTLAGAAARSNDLDTALEHYQATGRLATTRQRRALALCGEADTLLRLDPDNEAQAMRLLAEAHKVSPRTTARCLESEEWVRLGRDPDHRPPN